MPLELYVDLLSQPSRSVYMFAKKNNLPVEFKTISLIKGEQHSEEFGKVNPLKKVPALKDGDFSFGESIPMMEYLAEKYNTPDNWLPKDPKKRALVNEYLSWQHMGMRVPGTNLFRVKFMAFKVFNINVSDDKLAAALKDMNSALDQFEKFFIQKGSFIGGDQISIADLVAIAEIMQPVAAGVDVFKGRPKLTAWKERVVQAVGKELFDEAHREALLAEELVKQLDSRLINANTDRILNMIR